MSGITENVHIHEGLITTLDSHQQTILSLFGWMATALLIAFQSWKDMEQAIQSLRKLGILYKIYDQNLPTPFMPQMK